MHLSRAAGADGSRIAARPHPNGIAPRGPWLDGRPGAATATVLADRGQAVFRRILVVLRLQQFGDDRRLAGPARNGPAAIGLSYPGFSRTGPASGLGVF